MSNLHDLQARAADLERTIADSGDQHGSLINGLESGLRELRQRLTEAKAVNDRLARENVELKSIVEQLLGRLETKPAESLHDKLAALDGQLYGLLELSGGQAPANGSPEGEPSVLETAAAAGENRRAAGGGVERSGVEAGSGAEESGAEEGSGVEGSGHFEDIRERMRSLSDQLLSPVAVTADGSELVPAPETAPELLTEPVPEPAPEPILEPAAEPIPYPDAGAPPKPPRAFERPIKALAEKAQSMLPKTHLRFDAETGYALGILRRIKGSHQPFTVEEVRELINGKFGLTLTRQDDAQLSASLVNQDGVARDPQSSPGVLSWRFDMG